MGRCGGRAAGASPLPPFEFLLLAAIFDGTEKLREKREQAESAGEER